MTMKSDILEKFPGQDFTSYSAEKIYVMDYTKQTNGAKGIEWSDSKPLDIDSFVVNNSPLLDITFCAFKENTIKLRGEVKERSHSEGVLFPTINSGKTWIAFLELKYSNRKQLSDSLKKAREQLLAILDLFRKQGIIEKKRLVHLIFSAPKYNKEGKYGTPFESWSMEPQELKDIRKKKYAIMRGVNEFEVVSSEKLKI